MSRKRFSFHDDDDDLDPNEVNSWGEFGIFRILWHCSPVVCIIVVVLFAYTCINSSDSKDASQDTSYCIECNQYEIAELTSINQVIDLNC